MRPAQFLHALFSILILGPPLLARPATGTPVELVVDTAQAGGRIDLTPYALGQGGLSPKPMIDAHIDQLAQLRPRTIRLFVQEYFDLYPKRGRHHWETLDKSIETILAAGAKPLLCLCFKPRALFPKIDQDLVHPTHYREWEKLIFALVKHCNQSRRYGIEYWEVGNEPDIGEDGGCPYRFKPEDYVIYYTHTVNAILRADPHAKVGGPALAGYRNSLGDALIEHCGKGGAPLHFFSWHLYSNDPRQFRQSIKEVKTKLAGYTRLAETETVLDEWNMSLGGPVLAPAFQPAFVLETTYGFHQEGLTRSAYYHIRDVFVVPAEFSSWMSGKGTDFMTHWWNVMPQYDGLWDNQGRVRPAYWAFQLLGLIQGQELSVSGINADVKALAARNGSWNHVVFWNFPASGPGEEVEVVVRFPGNPRGQFRFIKLDASASVNPLALVRHGNSAELEAQPIQMKLDPYGAGWIEVGQ